MRTNPRTESCPPADAETAPLLADLRSARDEADLDRAFEANADTLRRLASGAAFDRAGYRRVELARDDELLVVLIGWLPGQRSEPHDHGGSSCTYRVLRGIAEETRFLRLPTDEVVAETVEHFLPGASVRCDGEDIHSLGNPDGADSPLVTLHVYRPAPAMRHYAIANRGGR